MRFLHFRKVSFPEGKLTFSHSRNVMKDHCKTRLKMTYFLSKTRKVGDFTGVLPCVSNANPRRCFSLQKASETHVFQTKETHLKTPTFYGGCALFSGQKHVAKASFLVYNATTPRPARWHRQWQGRWAPRHLRKQANSRGFWKIQNSKKFC